MVFGSFSVAMLVVRLSLEFFRVALLPTATRLIVYFQVDVHHAANLLGAQQFAVYDVFALAVLLSNPGAKQVAKNHQIQMAVDALPLSTLEVIQA